MPVFTVESSLAPGLGFDKRFRHWGKLIRSDAEINLKLKGGHALTGPFVKWGEKCPLDEGQFLVLASETGSQARHSYDYALVQCLGGRPSPVLDTTVLGAVLESAVFTSEQSANAQNSELYGFACYTWLCFQARRPAETLEKEARRQGLAELTRLSDEYGLYDVKPIRRFDHEDDPVVMRLGQRIQDLSTEILSLKEERTYLRENLRTFPERVIRWLADGRCDEAILATLDMEADVWRGDPAVLAKKFREWEDDEYVRRIEAEAEY